MAVKDYRVRYGRVWYQHRPGENPTPETFAQQLEQARGTTVRWGNGMKKQIDPGEVDSSYIFLVDGLFQGAGPEQIDRLVDDEPQRDGTVY